MSWSPTLHLKGRRLTARGIGHEYPIPHLSGRGTLSSRLKRRGPPERSMTEMKLEDLKLKSPTEMLSFAEENGV